MLGMSRFLARTQDMVEACGAGVPVEQNPGAQLGIILGTAARNGRDKLTLIASPGISALGAWLEQLVAESTGKQGKGIVPVDREDLGPPEIYGNDRMFAYVRLESAPDKAQDAKVAALEQAGHPCPHYRSATFTIWARNSSAGKSPRRSAPSSRSTPSTSPMLKPARSQPAT